MTFYSDEDLSRELNLGLHLNEETNTNKASYIAGSSKTSVFSGNAKNNIENDMVDWSDEGEEDDDTPRNHDLLSRLAEESEDDGDDVLQFSRLPNTRYIFSEGESKAYHCPTNKYNQLHYFRRTTNSHSGRWSSFSWSSLYERAGTDSSLSWAEDVSIIMKYRKACIFLIFK